MRPGQQVVYAQTGGSPALFAYADDLMPQPYSVLELPLEAPA